MEADVVWLKSSGGRQPSPPAVCGAFVSLAAATEKVGLPKLMRHMMRHTFATFLGSKGATDMDLMDLGGWKSVAMVRRYRKVVDERLDDVMDAFNDSSEEQISEQ